jgi:hypothetical protein
VERDVSSASETLLAKAVPVWRKAQIVHQAPSWEGRPEARATAEELADHPEYEPFLFGLLADPSQLVVAYSLMTLELMGSIRLKELPPDLLTNRSKITLMVGSFRIGKELGGLAREVQKRAMAAAAAS